MGAPLFLVQIVRTTDNHPVAIFPGGRRLERDLIEICAAALVSSEMITACTQTIVDQGVGFFRTEAAVTRAIATGMKDDTVKHAVGQVITQLFADLKAETRSLV